MKPPPFTYHDPRDVGEVLGLLAEHGDEGKLLAGGQSLVPVLNFRLAHPSHLFDLNRVGSLAGIVRRDGTLRIGSMTRQATLEASPLVAEHWPILRQATRHVAHPQIRNRGTVGGSVAHADPAAELPAAFAALEARFRVCSRRGERTISAEEMFVTHMTTAIAADELLVEIEVPPTPPEAGHAFVEFSRRHGDFALGGAAVLLDVDEAGVCRWARIALLGAAPTPLRRPEAEAELIGGAIDTKTSAAAAAATIEGIDPTGDIHGSGQYRRELIEALVRRAIGAAAARSGTPRTETGAEGNGSGA